MLQSRILFWLFTVMIFIVSCLASFFLVLNSVFSDGALSERLMVFSLIGVIYAMIAGMCGAVYPGHRRWWMTWLCAPAILILVLYTLSELSGIFLHLLAALCVLLPTHVVLKLTDRQHC